MKNTLLVISLLMLGFIATAQQDPQFSMNYFNRQFPNAATVAVDNKLQITMIGRHQWSGFGDGNPKTYMVSAGYDIDKINSGVGITAARDALGNERTSLLDVQYRYSIGFENSALSFGTSAGYLQKRLGAFTDDDALDGISSDPVLVGATQKSGSMDFSFGSYYKRQNFYMGFSSKHLHAPKLSNLDGYRVARHYYLMAGYDIEIGEKVICTPNIFTKSDGTSTQLDLNTLAWYDQKYMVGITYRMRDAFSPMIGYKYKSLQFAYSYDISTNDLKRHASGSHEVILRYTLAKE